MKLIRDPVSRSCCCTSFVPLLVHLFNQPYRSFCCKTLKSTPCRNGFPACRFQWKMDFICVLLHSDVHHQSYSHSNGHSQCFLHHLEGLCLTQGHSRFNEDRTANLQIRESPALLCFMPQPLTYTQLLLSNALQLIRMSFQPVRSGKTCKPQNSDCNQCVYASIGEVTLQLIFLRPQCGCSAVR